MRIAFRTGTRHFSPLLSSTRGCQPSRPRQPYVHNPWACMLLRLAPWACPHSTPDSKPDFRGASRIPYVSCSCQDEVQLSKMFALQTNSPDVPLALCEPILPQQPDMAFYCHLFCSLCPCTKKRRKDRRTGLKPAVSPDLQVSIQLRFALCAPILAIAPHVPSLCPFGCLYFCFVLGLVPFWALHESFFFFLFLWCLLALLGLKAAECTLV